MLKTTVAVEKLSGTISPIKCLINSHKTKRYQYLNNQHPAFNKKILFLK